MAHFLTFCFQMSMYSARRFPCKHTKAHTLLSGGRESVTEEDQGARTLRISTTARILPESPSIPEPICSCATTCPTLIATRTESQERECSTHSV